MSNKLILILIACLFCTCTKKSYGPKLLTDSASNSLNFGLIGLNDDHLFLNKINDVTLYDFNGNQIKILKSALAYLEIRL